MEILLTIFFMSLMVGQLGAIPLAPNVTLYIHDIILGVVLILGIIMGIRRKKKIVPKLLVPISAFIAAGIVSLAANSSHFNLPQLGEAALYLLRFAAYAGLYGVLAQGLVSPEFLLNGLYGMGIGLSLLGFIQYLWYPDLRNLYYLGWDPHYYRLFSTLLDPNFAGILIVLTLILGVFIWQKKKSPGIVVLQIINLVALYLTYSRSAYLAFVLAVLAYVLLRRQWKILIFVAVFIVALIAIPKPGGSTLLLTRVISTTARIGNWQESLKVICEAPVFGHGFDTLRFLHIFNNETNAPTPPSRAAAGLDSSILFILATTGVVGLAAYGWIIVSWMRICWGNRRLADLRDSSLAVLVALLTHSLFNNSLFYPWVMIWFWVFTGATEVSAGR